MKAFTSGVYFTFYILMTHVKYSECKSSDYEFELKTVVSDLLGNTTFYNTIYYTVLLEPKILKQVFTTVDDMHDKMKKLLRNYRKAYKAIKNLQG